MKRLLGWLSKLLLPAPPPRQRNVDMGACACGGRLVWNDGGVSGTEPNATMTCSRSGRLSVGDCEA